MAQWYRNPPSPRFLAILGIVLALAAVLVLVERTVGWPDWLTTQPVPIRRH